MEADTCEREEHKWRRKIASSFSSPPSQPKRVCVSTRDKDALPNDYYKLNEFETVTATPKLQLLHEQFISVLLKKKDKELEGCMRLHPSLPCNNPPPHHSLSSPPLSSGELLSCPSRFHCYELVVTPPTHYQFTGESYVTDRAGKISKFSGFLMISSISLDMLCPLHITHHNLEHTITLKSRSTPLNFVLQDLLLMERYMFTQLLELYSWAAAEISPASLHFLPLFTRTEEEGGETVLVTESAANILYSWLNSYQPITALRSKQHSKHLNSLAYNHDKAPSCIRVDQLQSHRDNSPPTIVHYSSVMKEDAGSSSSFSTENTEYKRLSKLSAAGELKRQGYVRMKQLKHDLRRQQQQRRSQRKEIEVTISSRGYHCTGIHTDLTQYALIAPCIARHVVFHLSLRELEETLKYQFVDRALLQLALTQPSYTGLTQHGHTVHDSELVSSISHCGIRKPHRVFQPHDGSPPKCPKRGLEGLLEAATTTEKNEATQSIVRHNDRLEFLGDAVVEFLTSVHLYYMFPELNDGQLVIFRKALVCNQHLATVAKRLQLDKYTLQAANMDETVLVNNSRIAANTLEAVIGAVYLDSGLETCDAVTAGLFFPEADLCEVWQHQTDDPLKQQSPEVDQLIKAHPDTVKHFAPLQESTGVMFSHVRLLIRAFSHPSVIFNNLSMGDYQRMEFLGDAILQLLSSHHVYSTFPNHHEGHLSAFRTAIVCNRQLAQVSQELGFPKYILTGPGAETHPHFTEKIMADVVESFIAALYIDKDIEHVQKFCEICLFPKLAVGAVGLKFIDPKSRLQHAVVYTCRKRGISVEVPRYRTLSVEGPVFTVAVYLKGKRLAVGKGSNSQEATMEAAEAALSSGLLELPNALKHRPLFV